MHLLISLLPQSLSLIRCMSLFYKYDNSFVVLNDMAGGTSKDYFYYRKKEGDCLVITVNDTSNRVACLAYYNDYRLVSKDLGPVDEDDD